MFVLLAAVPAAAAQIQWSPAIETVTVLPTFGGLTSFATAVSELGHVVGASTTESDDQHAFLWTPHGGMRDLTPHSRYSIATDVNDFGKVVGFYKTDGWLDRPFLWTPDTGAVDLPVLGHADGTARAINNAGQILGTVGGVDVIWSADGTMREVSTIVGQPVTRTVMNEFGDLAGWSPAGAFRWSPHSGFTVLGTFALPSDINEAGDIVGMARLGDSVSAEPFLWTPARTYRLLPEVLGENNAEALNNVRQVVGWAEGSVPTGWDSMAVLWAPATGLVPLWPTNGEDGMMGSAVDINDQGIVVGKAEMPVRPGHRWNPRHRSATAHTPFADRVRIACSHY